MRFVFGLVLCIQPELARNELEVPRGLPRSDVSVVVPAGGAPIVAGASGALLESPQPIVAYVIAPPDLFATKTGKLTAYGLTPERVPPVVTTQQCIKEYGEFNPGPTGCFLAHQDAWRRISKAGRPGIVFEADFSAGDLASTQVAAAIREAMGRPDDKLSLGHCEDNHMCTTAYILKPRAAAQLLEKSDPLCAKVHRPVDHFILDWCKTVRCSYVDHDNMPPLYGLGIFQQDRSLSSMHGKMGWSTGQNLATVGAVVGEPESLSWHLKSNMSFGHEFGISRLSTEIALLVGVGVLVGGLVAVRRYKDSRTS